MATKKPTSVATPAERRMLARDLTERFGVLTEHQLHQLRIWPMVVFGPGKKAPKSAEVSVDMENKIIAFYIEWKRGISTGKAAKKARADAMERLTIWTRQLLGGVWTLVGRLNVGGRQEDFESIVSTEEDLSPIEERQEKPWKDRLKF